MEAACAPGSARPTDEMRKALLDGLSGAWTLAVWTQRELSSLPRDQRQLLVVQALNSKDCGVCLWEAVATALKARDAGSFQPTTMFLSCPSGCLPRTPVADGPAHLTPDSGPSPHSLAAPPTGAARRHSSSPA